MIHRRIRCGLAAAALGGLAAMTPAAAQDDRPIPGDVTVARVGGETIMLSEIVGAVYALPEEERAGAGFDALYEDALRRRVDGALLFNAAVAQGLRETAAHRRAMAEFERRTLTDAYLRREVAARVSDGAARARYDAILAGAAGKTELRARRIRAAGAREAEALRARIAAGEDFAAVAETLDFPGADAGGDLGWFAEGNMIPEIVAAARALAPGQVSAPFPTPHGWHLIELLDIRPTPMPAFGELRERIMGELTAEAVAAVLAGLRAATPVALFDRDGTPRAESPPEESPR